MCCESSDTIKQSSSTAASTRATNRTETAGAAFDQTRFLNKCVQTLIKRAFAAYFPKRLDGKFHPSIPAATLKSHEYCQHREHLHDPSAGE